MATDWFSGGSTSGRGGSSWFTGGGGTSSTGRRIRKESEDEWEKRFKEEEDEREKREAEKRVAQRKPEDKRGLLEKVVEGGRDFFTGAAKSVAKTYKDTSEGIAEAVGYESGDQQEARASQDRVVEENMRRFNEISKQLKSGKLDPKKKDRLEDEREMLLKSTEETQKQQLERNEEVLERTDPTKRAADVVKIGADVLSAGTYGAAARGAQAGRLARADDLGRAGSVSTFKTVRNNAAGGAAINSAAGTAQQFSDDEEGFDFERLAADATLGGVLGGLGGAMTARATNRGARQIAERDKAFTDPVDEAADRTARELDAEDAFMASRPDDQKLLGTGEDRMQSRINEIDERLDELRGTGSTFEETLPTMDDLGQPTTVTGSAKDFEFNRNRVEGEVTSASGTKNAIVDNTRGEFKSTADEARSLMRERQALLKESNGLKSIENVETVKPTPTPKLDTKDPVVREAVDNELQAIETALVDKQVKKVNTITDYFRTPTKVLDKIGLRKTSQQLEESFQGMRYEQHENFHKVAQWAKALKTSPDGSQRVFRYLDGDKSVRLSFQEKKIADEMAADFKQFADRLGIPEEKRVSDYITHIFDKDFKGETLDPNLTAILDSKPTSKTYNPYTQKRLGKQGYKEDALAAYEAYMKRATRSIHMDPALKMLSDASKNVDDRTARYLIKLNESVALKPTKFEEIMNDAVASIPGADSLAGSSNKVASKVGGALTNQGATRAMRGWRNTVYRATLGLNLSSAMRNLTQGTNTFAELGTRDTLAGYSRLIRDMARASQQKSTGQQVTAWDYLNKHGILEDALHRQDQNMSALSDAFKSADRGLWAMFDLAERINRGSAFYAAMNRATRKGMSEAEAIKYARDIVGKTQFRFNDVETPLILRSQIAKTAGQFQSFNMKQADFLAGKVKGAASGNPQEIAGAIRWIGANIAIAATLGKVLGLDWHSSIPDFGAFRGVRSPVLDLGKNVAQVVRGKDDYGQDVPLRDEEGNPIEGTTDRGKIAKDSVQDLFGLIVPGGTQAKKSYEGIEATNRGGSYTAGGRLRYPIDTDGRDRAQAAMFGQYVLPEGREYFDKGGKALSDKQTEVVDTVNPDEREEYYDFFHSLREVDDTKTAVGKKIRAVHSEKQFEKGKRLAYDHNAEVDMRIRELEERIGPLPKDIREYIDESYKVDYNYYRKRYK